MISALFCGVSGMRNHLVRMNVVGHNIANINTIGFKSSRVTFAEMMAQTLRAAAAPGGELGGTNPVQYGLGMVIRSTDINLGQGGLELTGQVTDLAIQGDGFFVLSDGEREYYSRAGNFTFDSKGYLVAPGTGLVVQGRMADSSGRIYSGATIGDIQLPLGEKVPGEATTSVSYNSNLNADTSAEVEDGTHDAAGLFARGEANAFLSGLTAGTTTVTVDWGGTPHTYTYVASDTGSSSDDFHTLDDLLAEITNDFTDLGATLLSTGKIQFTNNAGSTKDLTITSTDSDLQKALAAANGSYAAEATDTTDAFYYTDKEKVHSTSISVYDSLGHTHTVTMNFVKLEDNKWFWRVTLSGSELISGGDTGTITFNSDGSLKSFAYDEGATSFKFDPNNGAETVTIDFEMGTVGGFDGVTQFAAPTTVVASGQDGYGMGTLSRVSFDNTGLITGQFSNGVNKTLGQIILADFSNRAGLSRVGDNLFEATANSGPALKGVAGTTVNGSIASGYLEMSNVDLAQEFVNMIITQRGFQANARVITTTDDLLTELVNLKR